MSSSNNNNNQKRERAYDPSRLTVDLPATAARPNLGSSSTLMQPNTGSSSTERLRSLKSPSLSSSNSLFQGGSSTSSSSSSLSSSQAGFAPSFAPKVVERRKANASDETSGNGRQQRFQRREFQPKFDQKNNRPPRDNNRPFRERTAVTPTFAFGGMEVDTDDTTPTTTDSTSGATTEALTEDDKKLLHQQLELQQKKKKSVFEGVKQPPTILPFVKPSSDSEELTSLSGMAQMALDSSRNEEQLEHVATRALFRDSRETTRSDELLFLQLPSSLPINLEKLRRERERRELEELRRKQAAELQQAGAAGAGDNIAKNRQLAAQKEQERLLKEKLDQEQKHKSSSVDDEENIWTIPFDNTLLSIPNGYIGEMVVHKSGKTKLKLGDVWFDVVPGSDFAFMEHVAAVAPNKGATYILGDVAKRVMCMPDVDRLLYDAKKNPLPVLPHPGMPGAAMRGRGRGRGVPPTRGAPGAALMGRGGRGAPPGRGAAMAAGRGGIPTSQ